MRTSSLDEIGDINAPPGSRAWAVALRRAIQSAILDTQCKSEHLQNLLRLFERHHGYEALEDRDGKKFDSYEAFCTCKQPWGFGYRKDDLDRILAERMSAEVRAKRAPKAKPHGAFNGNQNAAKFAKKPSSPKQPIEVDTINFDFQNGGDSANYLVSRLARDHPVIFERMKAGEFPSVQAAAIEAGIKLPMISKVSKEPKAAARLLARHFQGDRLAELIRELQAYVAG